MTKELDRWHNGEDHHVEAEQPHEWTWDLKAKDMGQKGPSEWFDVVGYELRVICRDSLEKACGHSLGDEVTVSLSRDKNGNLKLVTGYFSDQPAFELDGYGYLGGNDYKFLLREAGINPEKQKGLRFRLETWEPPKP